MNLKDLKRRLCMLGALLIAASAVFLYFSSKTMPWETQTWDGNSINEIQYRALRFTQSQIGLLLLVAGSVVQLFCMANNEDLYWIKKVFNKIVKNKMKIEHKEIKK